jgi:hypothetical protein
MRQPYKLTPHLRGVERRHISVVLKAVMGWVGELGLSITSAIAAAQLQLFGYRHSEIAKWAGRVLPWQSRIGTPLRLRACQTVPELTCRISPTRMSDRPDS